jgi:hypothetical protein
VIEVVREGYLPDRYGDRFFDSRFRNFDRTAIDDGDGGTMCA